MKKLREIIRQMGLKDNEMIITVDELEKLKAIKAPAKVTKNKKKTGRQRGKVLWTDKNNPALQIRQRKDAIYLYYYDKPHQRPYQRKGNIEVLQELAEKFKETGYNLNKFYEIQVNEKQSNPHKYITKNRGTYTIKKSIKGKIVYFGRYSEIRLAEEVKQFLIFKNWDLKYRPENVTPAYINRLGVDEYYRTLKPIMFADKDYQEYKKNKGVLT